MSGRRVLLLGASGETGKELLKVITADKNTSKLILVGRRELSLSDTDGESSVEQRVVSFDDLDASPGAFEGVDVAFCCLGTTRAKAGADGFVKVDHDYVVNSAKKLKEAGCNEFHLLTSRGSNASSFLLYTKTKGLAEDHCKEVGFDRLSIYRPGLLKCAREESRFMEKMAQCFAGAVDKSGRFSISTADLARAMFQNSSKPLVGDNKWEILEHNEIFQVLQ